MLQADGIVKNFYAKLGTMGMADVQNHMGGLPVRNFSAGRLADTSAGREVQDRRRTTSASSTRRAAASRRTPACPAASSSAATSTTTPTARSWSRRSSTRPSASSASNCGLSDPDDLAQLNFICQRPRRRHDRDRGDAGRPDGGRPRRLRRRQVHGRLPRRDRAAARTRAGIWAQGTARVGEHYGVRRTPVIKKQAISAYDPRVVEATGITMMATAQGADHTAGNLPRLKTREMDLDTLIEPEPRSIRRGSPPTTRSGSASSARA